MKIIFEILYHITPNVQQRLYEIDISDNPFKRLTQMVFWIITHTEISMALTVMIEITISHLILRLFIMENCI